MKFDVNRLSTLAGIPSESGRRSLNEASNRSYHDDNAGEDTAEWRFGKGQLAEQDGDSDDKVKTERWSDQDVEVEGDHDGDTDEAIVLEIDDDELKKEVRRMKNQRLEENRLRVAIRNEIRDIFRSAGVSRSGAQSRSQQSDSSWFYGENKPRNSKKGFVTNPGQPFGGFGFKR